MTNESVNLEVPSDQNPDRQHTVEVEQKLISRQKRKRVSMACQRCRNSRIKCCESRPCQNCCKAGLADSCNAEKSNLPNENTQVKCFSPLHACDIRHVEANASQFAFSMLAQKKEQHIDPKTPSRPSSSRTEGLPANEMDCRWQTWCAVNSFRKPCNKSTDSVLRFTEQRALEIMSSLPSELSDALSQVFIKNGGPIAHV